ncbi:MAG: DUF1826 domain-containing protein [Pseudomonadota bacterium]
MAQPIPRQAVTQDLPSHAIGKRPEVLYQIRDPVVNIALWQRSGQADITRELEGALPTRLTETRCDTSSASFGADIVGLFEQLGLDSRDFPNLRRDFITLAGRFFGVSEARLAQVRLVFTAADECRRFHVDRRRLRLLCTYQGPGTEWLMDSQVDRFAQENGAPNEAIIRFGKASHFEPFWVGIMKGDPYNGGRGLVHRSPPISGTGQTRVLFCLDC